MFFSNSVDYEVLFHDRYPSWWQTLRPNSTTANTPTGKVHLGDVVIAPSVCLAGMPFLLVVTLAVALLYWCFRVAIFILHLSEHWRMRQFYAEALAIESDSELANLTWHEVIQRLLGAQRVHHMCVHKSELTELDIYQRILRIPNYLTAMINKSVVPLRIRAPFGLPELLFFTRGYRFNLELILFRAFGAPFESSWSLREPYRRVAARDELVLAMRRRILYFGLANIFLAPLIFVWQLLYAVFSYAESIRRDPAFLGSRRWSAYARL